jgi:DNA-binding NarL/FixJ family response regulator
MNIPSNPSSTIRGGLRVMVLEDEPLVAMSLGDMLTDLGFTTVGPFLELDEAESFVQARADEIDVAILDVNISGQRSFGLADLLRQRDVPFFFSSGCGEAGIDQGWRRWPNIGKLFSAARLLQAIEEACASRRAAAQVSQQTFLSPKHSVNTMS